MQAMVDPVFHPSQPPLETQYPNMQQPNFDFGNLGTSTKQYVVICMGDVSQCAFVSLPHIVKVIKSFGVDPRRDVIEPVFLHIGFQ